MNAIQTLLRQEPLLEPIPATSCEHRAVARDGRIICSKIVEGDNQVSPNVCRSCPFKAANCGHLRFSLRQTEPHRLVVRYNGRTEIWDDDPPEVRFEQAACAAKVLPIHSPRQCAGCSLRQPVRAVGQEAIPHNPRRVVGASEGVPFAARQVAAVATG